MERTKVGRAGRQRWSGATKGVVATPEVEARVTRPRKD